jgi:hypothetical protein
MPELLDLVEEVEATKTVLMKWTRPYADWL